MYCFVLIGVFILTSEIKAVSAVGENSTSANDTNAVTTAIAAATTNAPGSMSIFAGLIEGFDLFKAKDEALSRKVKALIAKDRAVAVENAALSAKVDALSAKVATLISKDTSMTSKLATLESKDSSLASKDNALSRKLDGLVSKDSSMTSRLATLESKVSSLTSQNAALTARVNVLETSAYRKANNVRILANGRLEIYHDSKWGTVCDDSWDYEDARAVCRHLGTSGGSKFFPKSGWGADSGATGTIWYDEIRCTSSNNDFQHCAGNAWGSHNCKHNEDVHMRCP